VLTGDSFFHLAAFGAALPGLNLCGAGRVVCLIDPVGDVYACPFAIHENFLAGNVRSAGGFARVWRESDLFTELRQPQTGGACTKCSAFDSCRGGCMAAKFFTGLPLDGPDPECVQGYGETALGQVTANTAPRPSEDHSHTGPVRGQPGSRRPVPVSIGLAPPRRTSEGGVPDRACAESPLAGFPVGAR
jgi:radical SAM protein with 4Fe4S-binding SPASM domain